MTLWAPLRAPRCEPRLGSGTGQMHAGASGEREPATCGRCVGHCGRFVCVFEMAPVACDRSSTRPRAGVLGHDLDTRAGGTGRTGAGTRADVYVPASVRAATALGLDRSKSAGCRWPGRPRTAANGGPAQRLCGSRVPCSCPVHLNPPLHCPAGAVFMLGPEACMPCRTPHSSSRHGGRLLVTGRPCM